MRILKCSACLYIANYSVCVGPQRYLVYFPDFSQQLVEEIIKNHILFTHLIRIREPNRQQLVTSIRIIDNIFQQKVFFRFLLLQTDDILKDVQSNQPRDKHAGLNCVGMLLEVVVVGVYEDVVEAFVL